MYGIPGMALKVFTKQWGTGILQDFDGKHYFRKYKK